MRRTTRRLAVHRLAARRLAGRLLAVRPFGTAARDRAALPATEPAAATPRTGPRRGRFARPLSTTTAAVLALALAAGCSGSDGGSDDDGDDNGKRRAPGTLRVLASSELSDLSSVLKDAERATGVKIEPTWTGTLDGAQTVASGRADGTYDAVWLASNDYLRLLTGEQKKIRTETPIVSSPVALGVREAAVKRLGWQPGRVTWSDVHKAVTDGKLTYGMTDPVRSNSGYSALIALTSALSEAQSALTDADVKAASPKLREFFAGQKLTSGSSGWLAEAFARRASQRPPVDALINYESVLLSLQRGKLLGHDGERGADSDAATTEPVAGIGDLTVIRPTDGVVTADYPLSLLTSADQDARDSYAALTRHLRSPDAQRALTRETFRRPVNSSVPPTDGISREPRRELPFPGSRDVADRLLDSYENELRRPSRTVYVLDTSGSMDEERLGRLKAALRKLTGSDDSATGKRFRDREEVTLMPFSDQVKEVNTHTVPEREPARALDLIRADVDGLVAGGDTAIYSSLQEAYRHLGERASKAGDDRFTSIVLMTDGENTTGAKAGDFDAFYRGLSGDQRSVPVFPILFGDSDRTELEHIADLTGGQLFDAVEGSLDGAFEEIRGYQ
ncbi:vWA domain-containing protein [Streptomyces buecherae]|uniref:vWA domain-containing protein n=1 Tax=Streptomyces buecherae TaxID=2763006 RepID=UPI00379A778C